MDLLDDRFRTAAIETIRNRTIPTVGQHVAVRFSSLGDDGVLLGAAALVAVNPLFVWYSQEARAYGLFVFTAARRPQ